MDYYPSPFERGNFFDRSNPYWPRSYDPLGRMFEYGLDSDRVWQEQDFNFRFETHERFLGHIDQMDRRDTIRRIQETVSMSRRFPLIPYLDGEQILNDLPPGLFETACAFSELSGLDHNGMVLAILGATSLATYGRPVILIDEDFRERTVFMQFHMSETGTRKSLAKDTLCEPFRGFHAVASACMDESNLRNAYGRQYGNMLAKKNATMLIRKLCGENGLPSDADFDELKDGIESAIMFQMNIVNEYPHLMKVVILFDSISKAQLCKLLQSQGECMGSITSEADMVKLLTKSTNDDFRKLVLRCYGQKPYMHSTAHSTTDLSHPALVLVCFVQPCEARKLYTSPLLKDVGILERIIPYFYSAPSFTVNNDVNSGHPASVKSDAIRVYSAKMLALLEQYYTQDSHAPQITVEMTPEARRLVKECSEKSGIAC